MQKSYCYTPASASVYVKVLEFKSFCIFSCILTLLIILIKPLTTKAYDRRASGDCGTSGCKMGLAWLVLTMVKHGLTIVIITMVNHGIC